MFFRPSLDLLTANDRKGDHARSYYAASAASHERYPPLRGAHRADVCVIGGGFTGLNAALELAKAGRDVVLLDANRIGWGASGRNGGQMGSGQRRDQDDLEAMVGKEHAKKLWHLAEAAKAHVQHLINKFDIDCDYRSGIIHADHRSRYTKHSRAYAELLQRDYDYDQIEFLDREETRARVGSLNYHSGTFDLGAGHLNPLNLALGVARACTDLGVRIFETTRVESLESNAKTTAIKARHGQLTAEQVLIACNGYLGNLGGKTTAKNRGQVMPINNFIVVTAPLDDDLDQKIIPAHEAVADSRFVVNYFRKVPSLDGSVRNALLFGGGETYGYRFPRDIGAFVRRPMLGVYPELRDIPVEYAWGGTLAITMNRMPVFDRLTHNIYCASGYSGHGVPTASLGGKIMAEAMLGDSSKMDVFSTLPAPSFPGGTYLRWPLLAMGMAYYAMLDRL